MAEEPRQRKSLSQHTPSEQAVPVPEPEPAHTRRSDADSDSEDEREATELRDVSPGHRWHSRALTPPSAELHRYDPVKKFWRHHVRITVPHDDCRDHLANERTFLGYLRTSLALAMLGVVIAQLYRLQHSPTPDPVFGYYVLSKPISCIFHGSAVCVTLLGAIRYFRQQHLMAIGKVQAGGWELMVIGTYILLLLIAMFAVHLGINIYKE